jgi:uncharacterized protein YkwD
MTRRTLGGLALAGVALGLALVVLTLVGHRPPIPGRVVSASGTPAETTPGASPVATAITIDNPVVPSLMVPIDYSEDEAGIFRLLNEDRRLDGESPVKRSPALDILAHQRSAQLISTGLANHCLGPELNRDQCPRTGLAALSFFTPSGAWAEILQWQATDVTVDEPQTINWGWLTSPPHHAIMLDRQYTRVGIASTCCAYGRRVSVIEFEGALP